jgi:hypothetical protein
MNQVTTLLRLCDALLSPMYRFILFACYFVGLDGPPLGPSSNSSGSRLTILALGGVVSESCLIRTSFLIGFALLAILDFGLYMYCEIVYVVVPCPLVFMSDARQES